MLLVGCRINVDLKMKITIGYDLTGEFATNHTGKYKKHGAWVKPVFPSNRSLQGSPATPYIFDDRVKFEDVADAIMYWYQYGSETHRLRNGALQVETFV
jgi:hypothetical protein